MDLIKPEPKEPTPEDVAEARLPEPLTPSEKDTFEARIAELVAENDELKERLEMALKPKKQVRRSSLQERMFPGLLKGTNE